MRYATEDGTENSVTIVGIDEVNPAQGYVSWISPIAAALLKAYAGDTVTLRTPSGNGDARDSRCELRKIVSVCAGGVGDATTRPHDLLHILDTA